MLFQTTALLGLVASFASASPVASPEQFGSTIVERDLASKSRLYPNGLGGVINPNYMSVVPPAPGTLTFWNKGSGPKICMDRALENRGDGRARCPLRMLQAFEIKYNDCPKTWVLCRCDDAEMSAQQIKDNFGRIPPKFRSWVKHIVAFQASSVCGGAGSSEDTISFYGNCADATTFIHEAAHSIDQGYSQTQEWRDTVERDSCIPDAYAGSSYAENFAQVTVVTMSQRNAGSTGGFNTQCMQNQMNAVWNKFGSSMSNANAGTCDMTVRSRPDSPIVAWPF